MKIKVLFAATLFSVLSYAQNGIIRGTVYEDETSEPLFYANAQIPNENAVAFTDFDGHFELSLAPGTYSLEISFLGLTTLIIPDVKVVAGEVVAFENLRLKPTTNELMTVTVTASAMRNTESALLDVKRKSATVMDGISAQNFKRIGDGNAAAAVTRVPGVSIQGGKYVFVRGLGDRYTKTQLMSMDIPGLDPDRNSLQMDIFPTNILQNIVVLKTLTADLPADFSGGLVNIELVDFPTKKTLNISSSLSYNPAMHLIQGLGHQGSVTDFLGFDSGFRTNPLPQNYIYEGIPNPALGDPITTELTEGFSPVLGAKAQSMPLEYLTYFNSSNDANEGMYVGTYLRFKTMSTQGYEELDVNGMFVPANFSQTAFGAGLNLGWHGALDNGLSYRVYVGGGYNFVNAISHTDTYESALSLIYGVPFHVRSGINIGYRF